METRFRGNEIMGIRIPTVFAENDAKVCEGCGAPIDETPFRVSLLDIVSPEAAPTWASTARLNPGPHEFHADPSHFHVWCRARGYYICRLSGVRELMRPIAIPGDAPQWGLCDGLHHEAHEFVPA